MTTKQLTTLVSIHAALVGEEIFVDGEGSLDRAVGHDLCLDLSNVAGHAVGRGTEMLILSVGLVVAGEAAALAGGGGNGGSARLVLASAVVVAVGNSVGRAALHGVVVTTSHQTRALPELPCCLGVATLATTAAREAAARHEVLGRDVHLIRTLGGNADTVGHGLHGTKGPAGATRSLVTNLLGRRAHAAPLFAGIEGVGNAGGSLNVSGGQLDGRVGQHTHLSLDVLQSLVPETQVNTSPPTGNHRKCK